jgi:hypothetical protein
VQIKAVFIINNHGKPRLVQFYERLVRGNTGGELALTVCLVALVGV